jgi:ATP-dependent RNA helicase RhlE
MSFEQLGLLADIVRAVSEKGYSEPTPIQQQAIPPIMDGRDLMGGAQTGTGKTAGFTLPVLHNIVSTSRTTKSHRAIRALVLVPTRELAMQVEDSVKTYSKYLPIKSTAVFGGVKIQGQISKLRKGVDVLVATPGRLLDHMNQNTVDLSRVDMLVLDEADRMLDMGFIRDIRKVLERLPKHKQTLLFSATFSADIKQLARELLKDPVHIEVAAENSTADRVSQLVHPVAKDRKRELLSEMIGKHNWRQVLVFSRTKHGADRLAKQLSKDGIESAAIHGDKSQGARNRALADFKAGKVRTLVATDIAARGLDISQLPHVVNFDLPNVAEDYVHRIGRTGRAGQSGQAVSLVCGEEAGLLRDIEKLIGREIPRETMPGYDAEPINAGKSQSRQPSRGGPKRNNPAKAGTGAAGGNRKRRRSRQRGAQQAA